jgi:catechol 2,3-dioxygenase-like lactoylglutathione lyase family enzyme
VRVLGSAKLVAFIPSLDLGKARPFYEEQLGLRLVSEDSFALVFDANGTTVRVAKVSELRPAQYTILGWEVSNVDYVVQELQKKGISLEKYNLPQQDGRGIWTAPSGAKVAWFKDPDGNVLSVSQLK